jgi:hypothetical protein
MGNAGAGLKRHLGMFRMSGTNGLRNMKSLTAKNAEDAKEGGQLYR